MFLCLFRIKDTDCFLGIHDRKLYVLGLCRIISLGGDKPYVLAEVADEILPSLLLIFEGLKRAYQSRAQEGEEEESEDEDGEDFEGLSDDLIVMCQLKLFYYYYQLLICTETCRGPIKRRG